MKKKLIMRADGTLSVEGGESVNMTPREALVLATIAGARGGTVGKDSIMSSVYQGRDEPELKIVDVFVCKVRAKLARAGADGAIVTCWGRGYSWDAANFELELVDGRHVTFEVGYDMGRRLDDLALALGCDVGSIVRHVVSENLDRLEAEAWS